MRTLRRAIAVGVAAVALAAAAAGPASADPPVAIDPDPHCFNAQLEVGLKAAARGDADQGAKHGVMAVACFLGDPPGQAISVGQP